MKTGILINLLLLVFVFGKVTLSQTDKRKYLDEVSDSSVYFLKTIVTEGYVTIYAFNKKTGTGNFSIFTPGTETRVYSHGEITCGYLSDTLIDVDGTGRTVLVVDLSRSCLSHQVNQLLIFQVSDGFKFIGKFDNTTIVFRPEAFPVFRMRLGHFFSNYNYSTLGYFYFKDGKQLLFKEKDDPVLKEAVDVCRNKESQLLEMKTDSSVCRKGSGDYGKYRSVWQSYFEQSFYAGIQEDAIAFFDKNYDCPDKREFLISLEKR